MATISVDDSGDLLAIRRAYNPQPGAKLEVNVHDEGVSIVANREGWLSLAEWCLVMAHKRMADYLDPYALTGDVFPMEMFERGDAITAFWGIDGRPDTFYQDVFFQRRAEIGDELWRGAVKSGNSPFTQAGAADAVRRYMWLEGKTRAEVEDKLGPPIFERTYDPEIETPKPPPSFGGDRSGVSKEHALLAGVPPTTGCAYRADTPEGWISIRYKAGGTVDRFGFGMTPPWEEDFEERQVVIPYTG
jgi:hypothetical protein